MKLVVIGILAIGSMLVTLTNIPSLQTMTRYSGSLASLVRYAYIGGFEGDDFLCEFA